MMRFMLFAGLGVSLLAADACRDAPDTPLLVAAAQGADGELRRLLGLGSDVDGVGPLGVTPLISAARAGAVDAMRALLDAGANPNRRDSRSTGWTPVMHAIHRRQLAALRLLLERGADPNLGNTSDVKPILMAAAESDPAFVAALLERGASARVQGPWGETPLSVAVSGGALGDIDRSLLGGCHPATVRTLLAHDPGLRLPRTVHARLAVLFGKLNRCRDVSDLFGDR